MRSSTKLLLGALALALLLASGALGQTPDGRGEVAIPANAQGKPDPYRGVRPNVPIPAHMHKRNEGGSDGQGLCVICSLVINGRAQGIPPKILEELWATAKGRPGGYSPDKLEALLRQVCPGEKYASYLGADPAVLERLSAEGYPIGATMNTGQLYNYRRIAHMISLIHFKRGQLACVVDNNDPGKYHWMPADEYVRRWIDNGMGWAFTWLRKPVPSLRRAATSPAGLIFLGTAALLVLGRVRRTPPRWTGDRIADVRITPPRALPGPDGR